jgi:hypothetical protein
VRERDEKEKRKKEENAREIYDQIKFLTKNIALLYYVRGKARFFFWNKQKLNVFFDQFVVQSDSGR